jgi:hypothetical protein
MRDEGAMFLNEAKRVFWGRRLSIDNVTCHTIYEHNLWKRWIFWQNIIYFCMACVRVWDLLLWCLTPLSTIFQLYRGGKFYWRRKTGEPRENYRLVASHWQTLSHNVPLAWAGFELTTLLVIDTDCIGSYTTNIRSRPRLRLVCITYC